MDQGLVTTTSKVLNATGPYKGHQTPLAMKMNLTRERQLHYGTIKCEAVHSRSPYGYFLFGVLKMPQVQLLG